MLWKASTQADKHNSSPLSSCSFRCQVKYSEWERVTGITLKDFPTCSAADALTYARTKTKHSPSVQFPTPWIWSQGHRETPHATLHLEVQEVVTADLFRGAQYATQPLTCWMSKLVISICTMQASKFSNLFLSWKWSSKSFITWAVIPISLSLKIYGSKHSRKMPLATEFSLILSYIWLNNRSLGGRNLVIK